MQTFTLFESKHVGAKLKASKFKHASQLENVVVDKRHYFRQFKKFCQRHDFKYKLDLTAERLEFWMNGLKFVVLHSAENPFYATLVFPSICGTLKGGGQPELLRVINQIHLRHPVVQCFEVDGVWSLKADVWCEQVAPGVLLQMVDVIFNCLLGAADQIRTVLLAEEGRLALVKTHLAARQFKVLSDTRERRSDAQAHRIRVRQARIGSGFFDNGFEPRAKLMPTSPRPVTTAAGVWRFHRGSCLDLNADMWPT